MSSSSKDTVDEDLGFVSKMKSRNNIKKHLSGLLATEIIARELFLKKQRTSIYNVQISVLALW